MISRTDGNDDIDGSVVNDETGVDLAKLNKYMHAALIIENRNKKYLKTDDNISIKNGMLRIYYPMKICTKEDFTSRQYEVTDEFVSKLKNRLCPDISRDDPNYFVKNLYQNKDERMSFSIQIFKCSVNCEADAKIEKFFTKTQFN